MPFHKLNINVIIAYWSFPPKKYFKLSIFSQTKKQIESTNNNVILKKFNIKIYIGCHIHIRLCYKQYKIRFYLQIVHNF